MVPLQRVNDKAELFRVVSDHGKEIFAFGVNRIGLFGSFVHDKQTPESDIDLFVEFAPGKKTFDNFIRLSFLLENLLHRRVELVTKEGLSPYLGPHIFSEVEDVPLAA